MKISNPVKMLAALLVLGLMTGGAPLMAEEAKPQAGQDEGGSGGGAIAPFPLQKVPGEKKPGLAEIGQKLSDPLSDVWALFTEFNHTWSDGDITNGHEEATSSDNKWNVPIGLGVAKTTKFGKLPVKFQLSVEKSVIRQDAFGKDRNVRLNVIPVIPALVKNPLF